MNNSLNGHNKMGYNSACIRNICNIFASIGEFSGMGHRMLPIEFYLGLTLIAIRTKFGIKLNNTIRLAISENHTLEPKITTPSYIQPKL